VQLVLLPPFASDVTPETPAQCIIQLQHGVTVRKALQKGRSSSSGYTFTLGGLALKRQQPVREQWYLRGGWQQKGVRGFDLV
jgi:hypothetical protein